MSVRCPTCQWAPRGGESWLCTCGHSWDTFATRGRCPNCGVQWADTSCPRCHEASPHEAWYTEPPSRPQADTKVARIDGPTVIFKSTLEDDRLSGEYKREIESALSKDRGLLWFVRVHRVDSKLMVYLTRPSGTTFEGVLQGGRVKAEARVSEEWLVEGIGDPQEAGLVVRELLEVRAMRQLGVERYKQRLQ